MNQGDPGSPCNAGLSNPGYRGSLKNRTSLPTHPAQRSAQTPGLPLPTSRSQHPQSYRDVTRVDLSVICRPIPEPSRLPGKGQTSPHPHPRGPGAVAVESLPVSFSCHWSQESR